MKYMLMMFGSQAEMMATQPTDWISEMIDFMQTLDRELRDTGELVSGEGLADGSQAKLVRYNGGDVLTTDGPYAESKEALIGFWIVDVESEDRAIEIASRVVKYSQVMEVRQVMDAPPDV